MGSAENFHNEIMRRIKSGDLLLGVSKAVGAETGSITFSRFWTLFSFYAAAGSLGILWRLDAAWWGYATGVPAVFIIGSIIGFTLGRARARRLAQKNPLAFMKLWDEGALYLCVPDTGVICMSPSGDYKSFMERHFLLL